VHWAHDVKTSALAKWIYRHCNTIIATNSSILHAISPQLNDDRLRHLITSNPVTEKQAEKRPDKIAARMQLGISTENRPLIVYTGKIGIGYSKELEFILSASTLTPEYQFLLTGGTPQAVEYWKKHCESIGASNVTFTGYIHDYSKIHLYQESADVLISYYTHQGHDVRYNLPNKLCEYMLTDNIVVSPDYPATRDLLHNENCKFVEAENAHALAEGIKWCIQNPAVAKKIAARAGAEARLLTFRSICAKLLKSIA
jgi:glycosyltransferase involved in cell wall biosynthesis